MFIALAIDAPIQFLPHRFNKVASVLSLVLFVSLLTNCCGYAQRKYFKHDCVIEEAGEPISRTTPSDALIIAALDKKGSAYCDPRLLFRARRMGWPIDMRDLSTDLIQRLRTQGATVLAIVTPETETAIREAYGLAVSVHPLAEGTWS